MFIYIYKTFKHSLHVCVCIHDIEINYYKINILTIPKQNPIISYALYYSRM